MKKSKLNLSLKMVKNAVIAVCIPMTSICAFLVFSGHGKYYNVREKFHQRQSSLYKLEKDIDGLQHKIKDYKEEQKQLADLLFDDKGIATFLNNMSNYANTSRIRIKEMRTEQYQYVKPPEEVIASLPLVKREMYKNDRGQAGAILYSMPIKITIEGDFEHAISFLTSLEKYRQLLTISNLDIKLANYPILECNFTLRLYSLKGLYKLGGG